MFFATIPVNKDDQNKIMNRIRFPHLSVLGLAYIPFQQISPIL